MTKKKRAEKKLLLHQLIRALAKILLFCRRKDEWIKIKGSHNNNDNNSEKEKKKKYWKTKKT